jgi:rRNA maturation RNase YbeY
MLNIYFSSDSRYKVDRKFVVEYLQKIWKHKELPSGILSVIFVGSRKARELAKKYINDDHEHPVLTFPLVTHERHFDDHLEGTLLGEIVICYPQVTLFAAEHDKEINKVIAQFLDHAVSILSQEFATMK